MLRSAVVGLCSAALLTACGEAPAPNAGADAGKTTASPAPAGSASPAAAAPAPLADKTQAAHLAHERHENFEEIGDAYKTIKDQLKKGSPDIARIGESAREINRYAPQVATWFPAGTGPEDGIKTDALQTVWTEPDRFREEAAGLVTAAAALDASAQGGNVEQIRAAAKALGGTCKSCHDRFREGH